MSETDQPVISKNELKRRLKREKREANKKEWREKMKRQRKEKRAAARQQNVQSSGPKESAIIKMEDRLQLVPAVNLVIDMSFDSLMLEKERRSLYMQLARCYAANRRSWKPVRLTLSSLDPRQRQAMDAITSVQQWKDPHFILEERSWKEAFPLDRLVYLTADSPDTIETLDQDKIYIIGGIVDRNRHKGITLKAAQEAGIATARLPIREYITLDSSAVLTVNQVFEMVAAWVDTKDWATAIKSVIPARKIHHLEASE